MLSRDIMKTTGANFPPDGGNVSPATSTQPILSRADTTAVELDDLGANPGSTRSYARVPAEEPRVSFTSTREVTEIPNVLPAARPAVFQAWLFEFIALLVSLSSFVAIIVLVGIYHEKPQPELALLSVNTLIAIFSTVLRATLLFTVAQVIGQAKWAWMEKPHPLRHVEHFDNAGTGAWGSLKFLLFIWKPTPALLGVLVVFASYAIGPFSQQAATVRAATAEHVSIYDNSTESITPELSALALSSLTTQKAESPSGSLFQCGSGNCTFEYSSVGFCSTTVDATHDLEKIDRGANGTVYRFPWDPDSNLTWPLPLEKSLPLFNLTAPQYETKPSIIGFVTSGCADDDKADFGGDGRMCRRITDKLAADPILGQDVRVIAINSSIFPCVRRYNTSITNGVINESLVSTREMDTSFLHDTEGYLYRAMVEPCIINEEWYDYSNISDAPRNGEWVEWVTHVHGTVFRKSPSECLRTMDGYTPGRVELFVDWTLKGTCLHTAAKSAMLKRDRLSYAFDCDQKWWLNSLYKEGRMSLETVSAAFDRMATAMSNHMRMNSGGQNNTISFVTGIERTAAVCIHANWLWLIYPGSLLLLTTGLLLIACVQSYLDRGKQPIWKSTMLPLLFYNVQTEKTAAKDDDDSRVPLLQLGELESLADKTVVRFSADVINPGFVVEEGGAAKGK